MSDSQIIESSRLFSIKLNAEGKPGSRIENISLVDDKDILWRQQIAWEVASSLKAIPSGIIVTQALGSLEKRVVIRAVDQRAFEILGIDSSLLGVTAEASERGARVMHTVHIRIEPGPRNQGRGGQ